MLAVKVCLPSRMNTDRELWRWAMRGWHGPTGGVADNLDQAEAAFRAAWDAYWVVRVMIDETRSLLVRIN
jgi:hypothetical protein